MTEPDGPPNLVTESRCTTDVPRVWPYDEVLPTRAGLLVVLSGPSGTGKDAVLNVVQRSGFPITKVVTATTRARRPNEVPGRDYHFLSREEFAAWRDAG